MTISHRHDPIDSILELELHAVILLHELRLESKAKFELFLPPQDTSEPARCTF